MSFDTPAGTRGGRQPRAGLMLRLINKNAASRFRRTGKMLGFNGLILTTVGARTGAERTSPVGWWPGPDGSWLIVAAAICCQACARSAPGSCSAVTPFRRPSTSICTLSG